MSHANTHDHHDADSIAHPLPFKVLFNVFALLMVLTFLTVAATWIDLGDFNVWLALLIAVVKAALVCLYFMHLRYDSPLYSVVLVGALLFVSLMMGVILIDSHQYEPNIDARIMTDQGNTPVRMP